MQFFEGIGLANLIFFVLGAIFIYAGVRVYRKGEVTTFIRKRNADLPRSTKLDGPVKISGKNLSFYIIRYVLLGVILILAALFIR
jgi:hypothetical protein